MFKRIAHWLGLESKDEALHMRFAKMRQQYGPEASQQSSVNLLAISRTGLTMRTVVGAEKSTGEQLRKNLLESYARTADNKTPVGSGKSK